jgi:hypothetical protein
MMKATLISLIALGGFTVAPPPPAGIRPNATKTPYMSWFADGALVLDVPHAVANPTPPGLEFPSPP